MVNRIQSIRDIADQLVAERRGRSAASAKRAMSLMQASADSAIQNLSQQSPDYQMAEWISAIQGERRRREEEAAVPTPAPSLGIPTTPVGMPPTATPATPAGYDAEGISEEAATAFQRLQEAYGNPLTVNSAYRDPVTNERVGGASGSQHLHGNAFDVDVSDMSIEERIELIRMAQEAGFRGIGVYNNSLHFDVGAARAWGPSYRSDSIPDWAKGVVP